MYHLQVKYKDVYSLDWIKRNVVQCEANKGKIKET